MYALRESLVFWRSRGALTKAGGDRRGGDPDMNTEILGTTLAMPCRNLVGDNAERYRDGCLISSKLRLKRSDEPD
jgi:hypothetical protein